MSTPHVCTFSSLNDCLSYSGSNCTSTDALPSTSGTCGKNDAPRVFLSNGKVCSSYTNCSATTNPISSGDELNINGQVYVASAGNTLTVCPNGVCATVLSAGTASGKVQLSSGPDILSMTATSMTGISSVVVGSDTYFTSDNGATFYKSTSNPPVLGGVTIDTGKEVIGSTAAKSGATYYYVNQNENNFSRDPNTCNYAVRFVQGDFSTYSGDSILMYRGSETQWLVSSSDCASAKANSNFSSRFIHDFRVFIDSNKNGIAYLSSTDALYIWTSGSWTLATDTAGCLPGGRTYFKISGKYVVYTTGSCLLNPAVTLTGTPAYDFTYGALTLTATPADISSATCFQNGTASYKFSGSVQSPTLNFFSTTSCAPTTVNANNILGDATANCSSLTAGGYAVSADKIVKFVGSDFSCSTPACIDVGDCQTDSCVYREGEMAGKLNCLSVGGTVMGMMYKENPSLNPSPSPNPNPGTVDSALSGGKIAAAVVTPILIIVAAVAAFAHFKAKKHQNKVDEAGKSKAQADKEKGNAV